MLQTNNLKMIENQPNQSSTSHIHQELAPLLNPLILENIFKFCSSKDLSKCRIVCKLWHYISLPFWSERMGPITLYEHARDAVFERNKFMSMVSFVELYRTSSESNHNDLLSRSHWPYRNVKLMFFRNLKCGPSNAILKQFWMDCGPLITNLQIFGGRLNNYGAYRDVLLCKFTPNVKIFKFSCQFEGPIGQRDLNSSGSVPIVCNDANKSLHSLKISYCIPKIEWVELFSHFPNMMIFELFSPYGLTNWVNEMESMLKSLQLVRNHNLGALQLKSINIHVQDVGLNFIHHREILIPQLLITAKLPLESLSLDAHLFKGSENAGKLDSLLLTYQKTLKKLRFRDCSNEESLTFPSVVMTSLEEIILLGKTFKDMTFLKCTPNLKRLHVINHWRSRTLDKYLLKGFIKSDQRLKLRSVWDLRYDFDCTVLDIMRLISWMPRVQTLQIPMTNESFRDVCTFWIELKHLTVLKDKLDDDGICGYIRTKELIPSGSLVFDQRKEHWPNIKDLTELRSFVMENHRYNNDELEDVISPDDVLPTKLTKRSIVDGFLNLPSLHKLSIVVEEDRVSNQLLNTLKEKIPDISVLQISHPYRCRHL